MTTATESVTDSTEATAPENVAAMFYGTPEADTVDIPQTDEPTAEQDSGHSDTPSASSDSPEQAKPKDSAGTESAAPSEADDKKEQGGHRAAAARLGKEVKDLKEKMDQMLQENAVLKQKLDGTYEEPSAPDPKEVEARAKFKGREEASRAIAEEKFGADVVYEQIYKDGSAYEELAKRTPWVQLEVMQHPQPTLAALRALRRQEFFDQYGDDPAGWREKIAAELKPELLKEVQAQIAHPPTGKQPPDVTSGRGGGAKPKEQSLADLFYGGTKKG